MASWTVRSTVFSLFAVILGCAAGPLNPFAVVLVEPAIDADEHLHNFVRASDRVFSGAEPSGPEAFTLLAELGVRTIVSVDGVRPNVEDAARHGLEYIHIPIGYDGVGDFSQKSLVRLVQERDGPFYIHCHHGRHRGPAAAAIACRADGSFTKDEAIAFLESAGTNRDYTGLYRDVANFVPPNRTDTFPELVSIAEVKTLAKRMAQIDRIFGRIVKDSNSQSARNASSVDVQDALLLRQAFRESVRSLESSGDEHSLELVQVMREAEHGAGQLCAATEEESAAEIVARLGERCVLCHQRFRD